MKSRVLKQVLECCKDKGIFLEGGPSLFFFLYFVFHLQSYYKEYMFTAVYIRRNKCVGEKNVWLKVLSHRFHSIHVH